MPSSSRMAPLEAMLASGYKEIKNKFLRNASPWADRRTQNAERRSNPQQALFTNPGSTGRGNYAGTG